MSLFFYVCSRRVVIQCWHIGLLGSGKVGFGFPIEVINGGREGHFSVNTTHTKVSNFVWLGSQP